MLIESQRLIFEIKQLNFRRILIIILINQKLYTSKKMGNKIIIDLSSLKKATISYESKTYELTKRIATYICVMNILQGENSDIEQSDFRKKYLDLYGRKGKNKEPKDSTVFYRSSLKNTFKKEFPNLLRELICYQEVEGKKREKYEEECSKRNNWIIKFYGSRNESYIKTKFSNVKILIPKEKIKTPPQILSESNFLEVLEDYRKDSLFNEIYRLVYSLLDLNKNELFKFSKQGAAFCVIYFSIALRQSASGDNEKLKKGMNIFKERFNLHFIENYGFSLEDLLAYIISIDLQSFRSIQESLNFFLNTKRSK